MENIDDFDEFLKYRFQESENNIADDGFTDNVLGNLPVEPSLRRNLILYLACMISGFIFIISSGYKSLLLSLIDIFNKGIHMLIPSLISFVVVTIFIGVSLFIARMEYDKSL